ncbi:TRAP transporter small permease subunit [Roseomonas stagni]|uniref:TRAP transporter small permease protein n=1 Tax=Falsiroseomonas algicola TaxID=2716930 RepID=A0A6M1LFJ4_9PROT|nr:TRAP transporter small permease subunit [Falsiroseomonas algicola]NGM19138.1 TRAP transporter small permease subunit [Falsiroseomonas algicola]
MTLSGAADAIDDIVDRIGQLSALAVAALVLVMASNVLLRYGFSLGSVWAQELEWHLMSPIALIGAAYALRHGEHVRVDVLYAGFSPRMKALVDLVAGIAGCVVCVLVIQLSWRYVMQSYGQDEGSANPGGIPARYILKAFIPAGFALLLLQFVAETLRAASRLRG